MFPSYVLSNLFVKGSLKNSESGFKFSIKNNLDSGTVTGLGPLTVDNTSYETDKITLKIKDRTILANTISYTQPVPVYVLSEIEFSVEGEPLTPGNHRLGFLIHTQEAGRLQFSITETLQE